MHKPGKTRSFLEVPEFVHNIQTRVPVLTVTGASPGPTLLCIAAQHGRELNGTAAIAEVFEQIDSDACCGCIRFVPVMNPPAVITLQQDFPTEVMRLRTRPDIHTLFNMNRGWTDEPPFATLASHIVARVRDTLLCDADALLDLHAWSLNTVPLAWSTPEHIEWARALGLPCFTAKTPSGKGLSRDATLTRNIPTVVAEFSGQSAVYIDSYRAAVRGIFNMLRFMGILEGDLERPEKQYELAQSGGLRVLRAEADGLLVPWVRPGAFVHEGDVLGRIIALNNLETVQELRATVKGICHRLGGVTWGEDLTEKGVVFKGQKVASVHPVE